MSKRKRQRCRWCGRLRCRGPEEEIACEWAHQDYFARLKRAVREADRFFGDDDSWQHGDGRKVDLRALRACKEAIE